jgi:hypothetical protein
MAQSDTQPSVPSDSEIRQILVDRIDVQHQSVGIVVGIIGSEGRRVIDGYVGSYAIVPNFVLTVTREGDHLFVQATGQQKFEVFPESDRDYFYKVVDAQITFVTDSSGRATELILHQNGLDQHAKRTE